MNAAELRTAQAPFKERYRSDPATALKTLTAAGQLGVGSQTCRLELPCGEISAGLHPAAGGNGLEACSAEILLQSLVACAGVTLTAVATAMELPVQGGTITAEGDVDFRGTLGVSKEVPAGFTAIRLRFQLQSTASAEQLATLIKLTERYCVIFQTLRTPPTITTELSVLGS
ncbi:MAG: OsmC family protein [Planctomycetota bacterium]